MAGTRCFSPRHSCLRVLPWIQPGVWSSPQHTATAGFPEAALPVVAWCLVTNTTTYKSPALLNLIRCGQSAAQGAGQERGSKNGCHAPGTRSHMLCPSCCAAPEPPRGSPVKPPGASSGPTDMRTASRVAVSRGDGKGPRSCRMMDTLHWNHGSCVLTLCFYMFEQKNG